MKKMLCAILTLVLALGGLAMAAAEDDARVTLIKCEQQDFSTACMEGLEWAWDDDNGLTIWSEERGSIPYLLIYRNPNATGSDFEGYFRDTFTPDMQADYGDRLIEVGEFQIYTVQGVEMPGQQYTYLVNGIPVVLLGRQRVLHGEVPPGRPRGHAGRAGRGGVLLPRRRERL